jgi:hypothetical protein
MPIPRYQDWMRSTALGLSKPRSLALRAVDSALQEYEKNERNPSARSKKLSELRLALNEWVHEKGSGWRNSERNKAPGYPISSLYEALNSQPQFTPADIEAFRHQDIMRRLRIKQIFAGKKIVWRTFNAAVETKWALAELKSASRGHVKSDRQAIREAKEQHDAASAERVTYSAGRYNAMRGVANSAGSAALDIASLVKNGAGASADEHDFGLAGTSGAGPAFHQMMSNMFGNANPREISAHLANTIGSGTTEIAHTVLPIISNVTSGAKMLWAWGNAAKKRYDEWQTSTHSRAIAEGDMRAAFQALSLLLERQTSAALIQASIQTADFASRTAMTFVDFGAASGTLIGAISTLSKMVHKLYLLGREYSETRHARTLLSDPGNLDCSLFSAYPLMGCYMLVCSDLSEIVTLVRDEAIENGIRFGSDGWQYDVEFMKKNHIDPILEQAAGLIYRSPFAMPLMPVHALYRPSLNDVAGQAAGKLGFAKTVGRAVIAGVSG